MRSNSSLLKIMMLFCAIIWLCQCTHVANNQSPLSRSNQQYTPYTMPAAAYLALAKNQGGNEEQNLLIMAAGRLIYDGQWREGVRTLAKTSNLSTAQAHEKNILLAKTEMMREQPRAAIAKLSAVRDTSSLPLFYQVQYHEILANAYETVGSSTESLTERIKLEQVLPDEAGRANNRRILWLTLTKLPIAELNTLAIEAQEDSDIEGWVRLALLARQNSASAETSYAQIEAWQRQYPSHPANGILPSPLAAVKPYLYRTPRQMALLLPLSGSLAGPGAAIRDGFMAAANNAAGISAIRLYDTAKGNVRELYQQALNEGADYVVGPLSKSDVASVAAMNHPVPTLLLNDLETGINGNAYLFGLSPANEARQVAVKASKNGYRRALVIAPSGAWGEEIVAAFNAQWQKAGGLVVDQLNYDSNTNLNLAVRDLLRVSESQAREKQLKQLLGNIEAAPSRRQDVDMIFLLGYPSKARQIMPLLKYYFAGDVPVYATSTVYSGSINAMKDRDLDGIIFCDMPWVFAHQAGQKNWPEQFNSYNRLYALGMDSFALATQLNQLLLFPAMGVNDKSGALYLNRAQQVARIPAWGKFKGGVAVAMTEHS
ncbi:MULTISPECIES: penicillin-binding protein activator [unclassified Legionella]|uniref:penicillin-binding protein activator n=1 Tax=unclassified Legionella TaxID=2622702 RepID=UPI001054DC1D|nr:MULTISPECIES: penicillin-binding protein activator [unclassified Legionella]MDI9818001.1 penicillin-binding protein activator [Legionella sp. PL877]